MLELTVEVGIKETFMKTLARIGLKLAGHVERMGGERLGEKADGQRVEGRRRREEE